MLLCARGLNLFRAAAGPRDNRQRFGPQLTPGDPPHPAIDHIVVGIDLARHDGFPQPKTGVDDSLVAAPLSGLAVKSTPDTVAGIERCATTASATSPAGMRLRLRTRQGQAVQAAAGWPLDLMNDEMMK